MNYIYLEIMSNKIIPPFNDIISDPMLSVSTGEVFYYDHPSEAKYSSSLVIDPKVLLEEILRSKDTDLQEDLKLVIRYLQGCLEETMDNPWFLKEIKDLREKLEETEKRCNDLEKKLERVLHNE